MPPICTSVWMCHEHTCPANLDLQRIVSDADVDNQYILALWMLTPCMCRIVLFIDYASNQILAMLHNLCMQSVRGNEQFELNHLVIYTASVNEDDAV
jgi:hypothetical protein